MMTQESDGFACELTGTDVQRRGSEWKELMAHVTASRQTSDGFRIVFKPHVAKTLEILIEAERACCSWATWSCELTSEGIVMDVSGPAEPTGALAKAFGVEPAG
jgi:hypothetical protein